MKNDIKELIELLDGLSIPHDYVGSGTLIMINENVGYGYVIMIGRYLMSTFDCVEQVYNSGYEGQWYIKLKNVGLSEIIKILDNENFFYTVKDDGIHVGGLWSYAIDTVLTNEHCESISYKDNEYIIKVKGD